MRPTRQSAQAGRATARHYGGDRNAWPRYPHEGPWTTEADRDQWARWRARREELDARRPREYVINGEAILDANRFSTAVDEALFGTDPVQLKVEDVHSAMGSSGSRRPPVHDDG